MGIQYGGIIMTEEFNTSNTLVKPEELCSPRYVEPSGLSREDAKRICKKNGVLWECGE